MAEYLPAMSIDPNKITVRDGVRYYGTTPITDTASNPQYVKYGRQRYIYRLSGNRLQAVRQKAGEGYGERQYNMGAGASVSRITPDVIPSSPGYINKNQQIVTDSAGNVKVVEQYQNRRYETVIAGPAASSKGLSGSGFERLRAAELNNPVVQALILKTAESSPQKAVELEKAGLINIIQTKQELKPGEFGYNATKDRPHGLYNKKIPLFDPVTGKPNIYFEGEKPLPEVIKDPKYGLMIRKDIYANRDIVPPELRSNINTTNYLLTPVFEKTKRFSEKSTKFIEEKLGYGEESHPVKKFAVGAAEGLASIPEFASAVALGSEVIVRNILRPKEIAKVTGAGAILTVGGLEKGFSEKPVETLGMLYAMKKAGDIGTGLLSKSPVKAGKVEVPVVASSEKVVNLWKGLYSDVKGAKPIVGVGKSLGKTVLQPGIQRGSSRYIYETLAKEYNVPVSEVGAEVSKPNVILGQPTPSQIPEVKLKGGFAPETRIETSILARQEIMRKFGYADAEIEKVIVGKELMGLTSTQPSKFIEKKFIRETGTLSPEGVNTVLDFVKEHKNKVDQLYGSFASRPQLKPEYRRVPGDIDIQLSVPEAEAAEFTQKLAEKLKESGEKVQVSAERKTLIEAKVTPDKWAHALDIHFKDEPITDALTPTDMEGGYGFQFGQKPIKIERIKAMRLSEQGLRKGKSSLTWQEGGIIAPKPWRLKDISDFYTVQKTLLESRAKGITGKLKGGTSRGEQLLERWKQLHPEIDWAAVESSEIKLPLALRKAEKILTGAGVSVALITGGSSAAKTTLPMKNESLKRDVLETSSGLRSSSKFIKTSVPVKSYPSRVSKILESSKRLISNIYNSPSKPVSKPFPSSKLSKRVEISPPPSLPAAFKRTSPNISRAMKILSPPNKSPSVKTSPPYRITSRAPPSKPITTRPISSGQQKTPLQFKKAVGKFEDKRKHKKSRHKWDIENPVPTFESLFN